MDSACNACTSWYCCHSTLLSYQKNAEQRFSGVAHDKEPEARNINKNKTNNRGNRDARMDSVSTALSEVKQERSLELNSLYEDHEDFLSFGFGQMDPTPTLSGQNQQTYAFGRRYVEGTMPHQPLGNLQMPHSELQLHYQPFQHNRFGTNTDQKYPSPGADVSWNLSGLDDVGENQDLVVLSDNTIPVDLPKIKEEITSTTEGKINDLQCKRVRKSTVPIECPECGEQFRAMNGLKNHEVKHMVNANYECDQCHMKFRMAHHLKHHYSTHFKSAEFTCQFCGKEFGSLCSLRTHEKKAARCSKGLKKSQPKRGSKKK